MKGPRTVYQVKKNREKAAFTIFELVIVIAILAVLMGVGFVGGNQIIKRSKEVSLESDLQNFAEAVASAMVENPQWGRISDLSAESDKPGLTYEGAALSVINEHLDGCKFTDTGLGGGIYSDIVDSYGIEYEMVMYSGNILGKTEFRVYIKSSGENKQTVAGAVDGDDVFLMVESVDNRITATVARGMDCGIADNAATANGGDVLFTTSSCDEKTAQLAGAHTIS